MATRNANQDAAVALVRRQNASVTPANISRALQALAADPKLLASIMQQTPRDPTGNMIVDSAWRPGNKSYDDFWSRVDPSFATQPPQGGASPAATPAAAAAPAGGERTLDDIINELLANKPAAAAGEEAAEPPATEVAEPPAAEATEGHGNPQAAAAASPMPASSGDSMLMELLLGGAGAGAAAYGASRMMSRGGQQPPRAEPTAGPSDTESVTRVTPNGMDGEVIPPRDVVPTRPGSQVFDNTIDGDYSIIQALVSRLRSLPPAQQRMLLSQIRGGM